MAEPFFERLFLVFLDLPTGYLLLEEAVEDRSDATWQALVDKRREALRAPVRSLGSDRAKARIKLAAQGLECLRIPDGFHLMHDSVKSYALAIGRQVRQARQEWQTAQDGLQRHQEREPQSPVASREATRQGETAQAEVRRWETVQSEYRQRREPLSLTRHPFGLDDSTPQTSAQVDSRGRTQIEAIAALAHTQQWPPRQAAMKQVKKQVPDLAALVDFGWAGVRQDLDPAGVSPLWQTWAQEALLPQVYWGYQGTRTRCTRRKAKLHQALESVRAACATPRLTQCLPLQALGEWHAWATRQGQALQRASSAVEGRNGSLAQLHHNQRGLPKHR